MEPPPSSSWILARPFRSPWLGTRHHLQAYLGLAERWVQRMRKEAGRIPALEIQQKVGIGFGIGAWLPPIPQGSR